MPALNRTAKDSVFSALFRIPQYALQLYQALHPEDKDVTEEDCKVITLENILTVGIYNDFALLVRDRLLIFAEAQATFTLNIVLRILLYLAETYKRYVDEHNLYLYGEKAVKIPRPEVYMVYTGDKKDVPEKLRLSDLYCDGKGCLELEVKVFCTSGTDNILEQYVRFCKIFDENRKKYGRETKTIEETLRQCFEEGVLAPFLREHEKEVHDIMDLLFSQERIQEIREFNLVKEAKEEGEENGIKKTLLSSIHNLVANMGWTAEQAMDAMGVPSESRVTLLGQL